MGDVPGIDPAYEEAGGKRSTEEITPSVLCPQGHVNAWNYKFCNRCGAPIGLVQWPTDDAEFDAGSEKSRLPLVLALAAFLVVAVVAAVVVTVLTHPNSSEPKISTAPRGARAAPSSPTDCAASPVLEAESVDLTSDGLVVKASFMSGCGGSDTESNGAVDITVADGKRDVAAGTFDFSSNPLSMAAGVPAHRTLIFPPGMYWRTPEMLSGPPQLLAARKGGQGSSEPKAGSGATTMVAAGSAKPAYGSIDGVAEAVLKELRDNDYRVVLGGLANRWVPQVSSKRVGLVAEGKTWTNADILRDHLNLRQRFTGARLVWSGQWTTFGSPNFWVTVVGPSFPFPDDANRWCDTNGFGADDCFAKFISTFFGEEGTTVYRK